MGSTDALPQRPGATAVGPAPGGWAGSGALPRFPEMALFAEICTAPRQTAAVRLRAPRRWRAPDGDFFALLTAPGAVDIAAVERWLRRGCPDPAPQHQGFVAIRVEAGSGRVTAAVGARYVVGLFWARDGDRLLVGSSLREVAGSLTRKPELDTTVMADFVALFDDGRRTPLRGVHHVPFGHLLRVAGSGPAVLQRWHRPEETEPIDPGPEAEVALMRDTVRAAVEVGLGPAGDVAATVSGGLDSTMVAATAARLLRPEGRGVHGFTHVPLPGAPDPGRGWYLDEGPWARQLAESTPGLSTSLLRNDARRIALDLLPGFLDDTWLPPRNPDNAVWMLQINSAVRERGVQHLLTGQSGNGTFSRVGSFPGPRPLRRMRRRAAGGLRAVVRRMRTRRPATVQPTLFEQIPLRVDALSPAAVGFVVQQLRLRGVSDHPLLRQVPAAGSDRGGSRGSPTHLAAWQPDGLGVWWDDPFSDARLVALAQSLPEAAWGRTGPRSLARRAAAGVLPDDVRLRHGRGAQAADAPPLLVARRAEILAAVAGLERLEAAGEFIDLPALRARVEDTAPGRRMEVMRTLTAGLYAAWWAAR